MSFVLFLIVGLSVGVMLYAISFRRLPLGVAGSLAVGLAGAFLGGVLGSAVAGTRLGEISPGAVAGTAFASYAAVGIVVVLIHQRRVHGTLGHALRRIRRH